MSKILSNVVEAVGNTPPLSKKMSGGDHQYGSGKHIHAHTIHIHFRR